MKGSSLLVLVFLLSLISLPLIAEDSIQLRMIIRASHTDEIQIFYSNQHDAFKGENSWKYVLTKPGGIDTISVSIPFHIDDQLRIDFGKRQGVQFEIFEVYLKGGEGYVIWNTNSIVSDFIFNSNIIDKRNNGESVVFKTLQHNNKFDPNMILNLNGINRVKSLVYNDLDIVRTDFSFEIRGNKSKQCQLRYYTEKYIREKIFPFRNQVSIWIDPEPRIIDINVYSKDNLLGYYFDLGKDPEFEIQIRKISFLDNLRSEIWKAENILDDFVFGTSIVTNISNDDLTLSIDSRYLMDDRVLYYFDYNELLSSRNSIILNIGRLRIPLNISAILICITSILLFFVNKFASQPKIEKGLYDLGS